MLRSIPADGLGLALPSVGFVASASWISTYIAILTREQQTRLWFIRKLFAFAQQGR